MVGLLRYMKDLYIGPPPGKEVLQDLEYAMRTKGGLTPEEDNKLRILNSVPNAAFVLFSGLGSFVGWFAGTKFLRPPPSSGFARFCAATGCAYIMGKPMYSETFNVSPVVVLEDEEGRMKMELANMWHPRRSYTDSAFVERMKEIEATNSDDEARTVSGGTTADNGPTGDLMEDPFACILGSPGDVESNNPPGNISTVLKRSELRAHRRSHRHHHRRHADDKFAAL
ncbi:uncharacterized protein LOC120650988 isoform X3 [Panicum virgatum]|uniref:Uncharacterized protein n=1 Tax=Panicum virgatum TaxID=38727 RepID=A0A8T0NQB5_PANVG|nr:uncharacterized protein LOC120650988 isoform X3 [Panicum virgatum]KAG2548954.1 hypothetical protein PVAP13_9KG398900 [Panicum virgatum]